MPPVCFSNGDRLSCEMKLRTSHPFPFQLALFLLLTFVRTEAEEFPEASVKTSAGDTLSDADR